MSNILNDPTLYYYTFLSRWYSNSGDIDKENHWNVIQETINSAWDWIHTSGMEKMVPIKQSFEKDINRRENIRLIGTDWLHSNSHSFLLEARALLDSVYLQIGISKNGRHHENTFSFIRTRLESSSFFPTIINNRIKIGDAYCFYAELTETDNHAEVARRCFDKWEQTEGAEILTLRFPWGSISFSGSGSNIILVLAKEEEGSIESASYFLNFIFPRFMLSYRKAELEYDDYELRLRKDVEIIERELKESIKGHERTGSLFFLEERILEISRLQDTLVEKLADVRQKLITLEANSRNIELILKDPLLKPQQEIMYAHFGDKWNLAIEQMKLDLNYFQLRNEDALLTLQTLHTFVDIKRGKTDRLMVIILGIVGGIIAISDALSEIPLYVRILLIIIVITWGIITWNIKREKK